MPPAIPAIVGFAAGALVTEAATAVIGSTILGSTFLASTVTGAIAGTAGGAASAAVTGGDVGRGAMFGAVGGGVGGAVSGALRNPSIQDPLKDAIGGRGAAAVTGGAKGLASGTTSALLQGQGLGQALKSGAIQGGLGAGLSAVTYSDEPRSKEAELAIKGGQALAGSAISSLLQPQRSASTVGGTSSTAAPAPTDGGQSAVLGQALGTTGDLGYSPTGPVFGTEDNEKRRKSPWNVESLRAKNEEQTA